MNHRTNEDRQVKRIEAQRQVNVPERDAAQQTWTELCTNRRVYDINLFRVAKVNLDLAIANHRF